MRERRRKHDDVHVPFGGRGKRAKPTDWYAHHLTPAKVGTIPAAILIHGSDKRLMEPGRWIRIKERQGDKWHRVLVEQINEDGTVLVSR